MAVLKGLSIIGTGQLILGEASETRSAEMTIQISGNPTGLATAPKAFLRGGSVSSPGFNVAYTVMKTGVLTDGGTTPISATGVYKVLVPAGCIVLLDTSALTSGTTTVDAFWSPLA